MRLLSRSYRNSNFIHTAWETSYQLEEYMLTDRCGFHSYNDIWVSRIFNPGYYVFYLHSLSHFREDTPQALLSCYFYLLYFQSQLTYFGTLVDIKTISFFLYSLRNTKLCFDAIKYVIYTEVLIVQFFYTLNATSLNFLLDGFCSAFI